MLLAERKEGRREQSREEGEMEERALGYAPHVHLGHLLAAQGPDSIGKKIGLSFGLKNSLRFHFDSATCLNYPFFKLFLV